MKLNHIIAFLFLLCIAEVVQGQENPKETIKRMISSESLQETRDLIRKIGEVKEKEENNERFILCFDNGYESEASIITINEQTYTAIIFPAKDVLEVKKMLRNYRFKLNGKEIPDQYYKSEANMIIDIHPHLLQSEKSILRFQDAASLLNLYKISGYNLSRIED